MTLFCFDAKTYFNYPLIFECNLPYPEAIPTYYLKKPFFYWKKKKWIARSIDCLCILQNVAEKEKNSAAVSMCLLSGVKIRPSVNLSWPHYRVSMFSSDRVENRVFEMQQMCYKKKDKKKTKKKYISYILLDKKTYRYQTHFGSVNIVRNA